MNARAQALLSIADDELIIGWRDSEWTGIAPVLEEDVAFSSIAQNEIGHARALYELAAVELGSGMVAPDTSIAETGTRLITTAPTTPLMSFISSPPVGFATASDKRS